MNIHGLKITQILLVRFDEIPLAKLVNRRYLERLKSLFEFSNIDIVQDAENIIILCRHGIHEDNGDEIPVVRLELQQRKIVYELEAPSERADPFFQHLAEFLADVAGRTDDEYLRPIVKSEESEIIAQLDFSIESLLSPAFFQFVQSEVVDKAASDMADVSISPTSLKFLVEYFPKDESLAEYRIGLSRKEFTVEPRVGYPLAEQIYYSKAPIDTNSHIELLEELEKRFSQSQ